MKIKYIALKEPISMASIIPFTFLFLLPLLGKAQADSASRSILKNSFFSSVIKNLELRQSFGSSGTRNEPVLFQFTLPKGEKSSYLIDGGVGIPFANGKLMKGLNIVGKLIGEYHRNTLIDDEQHTWQTGFSSTIRTNPHEKGNTFTQLFLTPTIKYSKDIIEQVNSFVFTMDVVPYRSSTKGINLNTYTYSKSKGIIHLVSVLPGFELQNNFASEGKSSNGTILRPTVKSQYNIAGNKKRTPSSLMNEPVKTWEVSIDYAIRYAVVNSTLTGEEFSNLLTTGFNYYLLSQPVKIAFGVSFNYGSDPLQGLKKQQYWLATLSIQK
jgi:hypothetical protein